MRGRFFAWLAILLWPPFVLAADNLPVDFDTQVVPILTKAGCNSGACHGATAGRGEFRLSLYGSRPAADYAQIVVALGGRRVTYQPPDESLLLRKPTEMLSHGGGQRLEFDTPEFETLIRWIEEGARRVNRRRLTDFVFTAQHSEALHVGSKIQLKATAQFDDGSREDVLPTTVITTSDDGAVSVGANGIAEIFRGGRHVLLARYLDRVVPLELLVPVSPTEPRPADAAVPRTIDDYINRRLNLLGLKAAQKAADTVLVRRLYLDLTGQLPSVAAVSTYLNDDHEGKQQTLVDSLLKSQEFNEFWTYRLALLFRVAATKPETAEGKAWYRWLEEMVAADTSIARMAREMIVASGRVVDVPAAGFYNVTGEPRAQAEFASSVFLGVRLQCANCHDHPLDSWTQDDYHGLAAIFATVRSGPVVRVDPAAEVIHPATGEPAVPRIPAGNFLPAGTEHREAFADWVTATDNPLFAQSMVNRIWKQLMGRGLVEPVDDLRVTNPPTHPDLMRSLADAFANSNYRLRPLIRQICLSDAYARSSQTIDGQQSHVEFYGSALRKPLAPAVYISAVSRVTGTPVYADAVDESAISLRGLSPGSPALAALGDCVPGGTCEDPQLQTKEISLQLKLLTGDLLNDRLRTVARQSLSSGGGTDAVLAIYRKALAREPTAVERTYWRRQLSAAQTAEDRELLIEDVLWSILTSAEFTHNH